jgi:L,D-transpeptidase-like protein
LSPGAVRALAVVSAVALAACSGASADQGPSKPGGHVHAVAAPKGKQLRTRQTRYSVPAGLPVERLALPSGPAFRPTCPASTLIGTVTGPSVTARTRPEAGAPAIATFRRINEQGARQVFDISGRTTGTGGHPWYRALLPLRPNDTLGYVPADRLHTTWTDYWILVERSRFRLTLFQACRRAAEFPVGIGTGSTPTPVGFFYLQSLLRPPDPNGAYGPYAYGLSGYSTVIHDWRWGGVVGLHGTDEPAGIGHVISHGCIRMYNGDITRLARILPLGTPITIV